MKQAEIYIARHGQNEDNVNNVLNGHRDLPLTDHGRKQAAELGEKVSALGLKFDAVYASPLVRAYETAQIVSKVSGQPDPMVMQEIIERDFGELSGRLIPEVLEICKDDLFPTEGVTYVLQGHGFELFEDVLKRATVALDKIRLQHMGQKVLLVCHGDIGKMLYASATGRPWIDVLRHFHFGNGDLIDVQGAEAHVIKIKQANL